MTLEEYKKKYTEEDSVGWDCIDTVVEKIYPEQNPQHFAPQLPFALGGTEPIDGISVYTSNEQETHFHYISYGFSELYYSEESAGEEYSNLGFELTFRLKKYSDEDNINWACNLIQNLGKYVFSKEKWFEEYHLIPANGPIRTAYNTDIIALAFVIDKELGVINTPHGEVQFLQMVGLTTKEYQELKENPSTNKTKGLLDKLKESNPLLITDLERK